MMTKCLRTRSSTSSPLRCPWRGSSGGTARTTCGARRWRWRLPRWRTSPHGLLSSAQRRKSWTSCGQGLPSRTRTSCWESSSNLMGMLGLLPVGTGAAVRCPRCSTSATESVGTTLSWLRSFGSSSGGRERRQTVQSLGSLEPCTGGMRRGGRCSRPENDDQ